MALYGSRRKVLGPVTLSAIIAFILSLGALIAFGDKSVCWAWSTFAAPDIQQRIDKKVDPVIANFEDALLYNSALHEATMKSVEIQRAEAIYEAKKKGHLTK